jgi:ABC-type dipeptide/oligopeptide/nickel transport system permease subunit
MKFSRIKERLGNLKRLFKENWILFRESRIGLFGLAVILFFVIVALLAPILDINDPIQFRAPEEDVIGIDKYWVNDIKDRYGPLEGNTSIAMRMQGISFNPKVDRIYVSVSNQLFAFHEFSSLASDPRGSGSYAWENPLTTIGEISTQVLVVNYGENQLLAPPDYWVYVGTSEGYLYLVNDTTDDFYFVSEDHMQLDSAISSIVVYNSEQSGYRTALDRIFVGTETGTLYAFSAVNHTEVWNITLDGEVHMTSGPMKGTGSYPIYSPAITQDGSILVAGTANGTLHAIYTSNGTTAWKYELEETTWRSSPIIGTKEVDREVVYFGTDEGWLYALYVNNGTVIEQWSGLETEERGTPGRRGVPVFNLQSQADGGKLTTPAIYWGGEDGTTIIFTGSSTGTFYKITRESVGIKGESTYRAPGSTTAEFREERGLGINYRFETQPVFYPLFGLPKYIFAVENSDSGTAQLDDDTGAIHAFSLNLTSSWKISEDFGEKFSTITSSPISWSSTRISDSVWFVTSDAVVYSYAASGEYLAPLPPTWIEPVASGNTYWLGLHTLGQDVFSMLVHGTRTALLVGFLAAFFSILIGVIVGLVSGYFGGKTDTVLMRFTDVILVLPFLPLVIVLAAVLGPSVWNIIIVIAILGWGGVARVIRSEVLSLKERPFIDSAKVTGASNVRIMFKHIAPNALPLAEEVSS